MPTLTTFNEAAFGRVRLEIDYSDVPAVTHFHVHRSLDNTPSHGTDPVVRMYGTLDDQVDAFGTWPMKRLSNGRAYLYDTEVPLDTPVWYRLDTDQDVSATFDDDGSITIASSGGIWLKDPVRPANDVFITTPASASDPSCDAATGIYFVGLEASSYQAASGRFPVEASPYPVVAARSRRGLTSSLVLATRQLTDRDRLRTLLASGGILLLQTPPSWGYGDMYIDVGDVQEARLARDHRKPPRQFTLPFVQVARPGGLSYGVDAARWKDLCDVFATWGAVEAAGKTWLDVGQREAG